MAGLFSGIGSVPAPFASFATGLGGQSPVAVAASVIDTAVAGAPVTGTSGSVAPVLATMLPEIAVTPGGGAALVLANQATLVQLGELAVDRTRANAAANGNFDPGQGFAGETQTGSDGADRLDGRDGADTLIGRGGADTLMGGDGNDHLYGYGMSGGADGGDLILGSGGGDYLQGNAGADTLSGGDGSDRIFGGADADLILGDAGNDTINGNFGRDSIDGGAGNDYLRGGKDDDMLSGGDGDDILLGDLGADIVAGGAGTDLFAFRGSDAAAVALDLLQGHLNVVADYTDDTDRLSLGFAPATVTHLAAANLVEAATFLGRAVAGAAVAAVQVGDDTLLFYASGGGSITDSVISLRQTAAMSLDTGDFV